MITANNTGLSGSSSLRRDISTAETSFTDGVDPGMYLREVCVAGSLPVIRTITDLLNSGDRIKKIDGILSVSLSYIMHRVSPPPSASGDIPQGCKFSEAIKEAIELGMMEKDPEKDLNNEYTARCLMVLVKELGLETLWDTDRIIAASDKIYGGKR